MKQLILTTEMFREAKINTMYQASLVVAIVMKPGITNTALANLMQTSREAIRVSLRALEKRKLVYIEKLKDKNGRSKETKVYPMPYLRDLVNNIHNQQK
jgi:transcription initiation factor IIE alpha subunit